MFDLKIVNGRILDGTGGPERSADIGIAGDRIGDIGNLSAAEARDTVDASGKMVCPGFIDVHSHSDLLEGAGQIYLDTLVELEEVPTEPIITQWQKIVPAADGLCSITGALPAVEKDFEDGVAYAWGDDEDDDELELEELADLSEDDLTQAYEEEPFLQFLSEDDQ